jgi:tetratricopeptide (TPR) repeat protein
MRSALAGITVSLVAACAPALHEPRPIAALAPGRGHGRSADALVHEAGAAWARRAAPGEAAAAEGLYLDAAAADPHRVDAVLGAMRAKSFRIEHEPGVPRAALAEQEVELGQWCQRRAPADPECDYRLAIALGQQARERTSTGQDALGKIVDLLHRAIARAPDLDSAGPHRVLALVLLRAPSWPLGPGDPEAALAEARAAVRRFPDAPDNQLALAEALAASGMRDEARAAYARALALATAAQSRGDLDAARSAAEARAGLRAAGAAGAARPR